MPVPRFNRRRRGLAPRTQTGAQKEAFRKAEAERSARTSPTTPRKTAAPAARKPAAKKPAAKKTSSQKAGFRNIEAARDAAQRQGGRRVGPVPTTAAGVRAATGRKPPPSGAEIVKAWKEARRQKTAFRKAEDVRVARTSPALPNLRGTATKRKILKKGTRFVGRLPVVNKKK